MDLTMVCGSRPQLLERTIESFFSNILCMINVSRVFVNIDLHGGAESDRQRCITIISKYFEDRLINTPREKSFGNAIKHLWRQPTTERFLHLEDDWIANRKLPIKSLNYDKESQVSQWFLVKPRIEQSFFSKYRYRPTDRLPFYFPDHKRPAFTTSPSILRTKFAQEISNRLNPKLNPEKQMYNGMNQELEEYLKRFRSKSLVNWWERPLISDIGRAWQVSQGIEVEIVDGVHGYRKLNSEN